VYFRSGERTRPRVQSDAPRVGQTVRKSKWHCRRY